MQTEFHLLDEIPDEELRFAVIAARYQGKWVLVRHKQRHTWEIPGGHREQGEAIAETAGRELREETGATAFSLRAVCEYSVTKVGAKPSYGRLYTAEVELFDQLPESEIGEMALFDDLPEQLTYPLIQPHLLRRVKESDC